ncbi:hypothetical protein LEN26_006493 [Aphanomyces euteiches]|nr:hypothetical protein AeMF1_007860 [Aphanomyces euteiches]KAH9135256.1 hypothetical protein LEN26_006493 [Aphanomyces euteiches]KAH9197287.1 hypothetical protein AeNC1_000724 [Aphanomyces euteiches]
MAKRKRSGKAAAARSEPPPKKSQEESSEDEEGKEDEVEMDFDELVMAGGALQQLGAHDAAAETFAKALALSPDNIDVMVSLASAYEASEQAEEAIRLYRDIVALAPSKAAMWFRLGSLLVEQNELTDAIEALKKVIELDDAGEEGAAYAALASCYGEQGDLDAAIALFENGVERHPESAKFHFNLATMLNARGGKKDRQKAVTLYEKAAELDPENRAEALEDLAALHEAMGKADKAKEVRERLTAES